MEPRADQLSMPADYGATTSTLEWAWARERLEQAMRYWLVTTRSDGTAHVVPVDGLWVEDAWYYGGSPETVHHRNLVRNSEAVVHLEDPLAVVVVEGTITQTTPSEAVAKRLAAASKAKYGYSPGQAAYRAGVWTLMPRRARAWSSFPADATRFTFDAG